MASKKTTTKAGTLPVVKHKIITIRQLGTRLARELEEEIRDAADDGYKVYAFRQVPGGFELQMGKAQDWTVEELMTEIREMLDEAGR